MITDRLDQATYGLSALQVLITALQTSLATQPIIVERDAAVLPASTNTAYFTVTGRVLITEIIGEVTIIFDGTVNSIKLINTTDVGADVDMCTALVVTSDAVGTRYNITGDPTDALVETVSGCSIAQAQAMIVPAGTIDLHTTATDTTGSTKWTVHYIKLDSNSSIVVA